MKKLSLLILSISLFSCATKVENTTTEKTVKSIAKIEDISKTLDFLTTDEANGREAGTKQMSVMANYLETLLKESNIKPYYKTYRDTISNFDWPAFNVVGFIEGNDPKLKNEYVIIGAHYDHIGKAAEVNGDKIANGANDNAVGTTAVTEVAKYFGKNKTNKRTLVFAFFTAEEKGLLGSKHMAANFKKAETDLYFMFNFEMIGVPMKNKDFLMYITGFGKSNMASKMNEYAEEKLIGYIPAETKYGLFRASDNYPFFVEYEVPAQTVSTFDFENYNYYHHVDDEYSQIDLNHVKNVIDKTIPVLEKMINAPTKEIKLNEKK